MHTCHFSSVSLKETQFSCHSKTSFHHVTRSYFCSTLMDIRMIRGLLLDVVQATRVWFQDGRVMEHLVEGDAEEDHVQLRDTREEEGVFSLILNEFLPTRAETSYECMMVEQQKHKRKRRAARMTSSHLSHHIHTSRKPLGITANTTEVLFFYTKQNTLRIDIFLVECLIFLKFCRLKKFQYLHTEIAQLHF